MNNSVNRKDLKKLVKHILKEYASQTLEAISSSDADEAKTAAENAFDGLYNVELYDDGQNETVWTVYIHSPNGPKHAIKKNKKENKWYLLNHTDGKVEWQEIDVKLNEESTTGGIAGYQTPFAFSRKAGNTKAAELLGYKLVDKGSENTNKKISENEHESESAGYNDVAEVVANNTDLLKMMGAEGLTEKDLNDNTRKFFQFIIKHLPVIKQKGKFDFVQNPQDMEVDWYAAYKESENLKESVNIKFADILNEEYFYNPRPAFDQFKTSITGATEQVKQKFSKEIEAKVLGKSVVARASKGYGQIEKDYEIKVADVKIEWYSESYTLIFTGEDKKDYYINPNYQIKVLDGADPAKDAPKEPEQATEQPEAPKEPVQQQTPAQPDTAVDTKQQKQAPPVK